MTYTVLARRWRPRRFTDLVGQEHVVQALVNGLEQGRLHHAFLFTGTRGVGKTTIARILAKSLNCETGVTAQPCGQCPTCEDIDQGRFVDLLEIDAASRTKVDDTREILDNVQYAPSRGRYKVYLIDEVHMLSLSSFNALLKTLEEPPPHVKFVLATTDPHKIPVTILSRCLRFNLRRLRPQEIRDYLQNMLESENIGWEEGGLTLIARAADGSMRDSLSLLDQALAYGGGSLKADDTQRMLGMLEQRHLERILRALSEQDAAGMMAVAAELWDMGLPPERVLQDLARALHRMAVLQQIPDYQDPAGLEDSAAQALYQQFAAEAVQLYYQITLHGLRDLDLAPDARMALEMTLLRLAAFVPEENAAAGPAAQSFPTPAPAPTAEPSAVPRGEQAAKRDVVPDAVAKARAMAAAVANGKIPPNGQPADDLAATPAGARDRARQTPPRRDGGEPLASADEPQPPAEPAHTDGPDHAAPAASAPPVPGGDQPVGPLPAAREASSVQENRDAEGHGQQNHGRQKAIEESRAREGVAGEGIIARGDVAIGDIHHSPAADSPAAGNITTAASPVAPKRQSAQTAPPRPAVGGDDAATAGDGELPWRELLEKLPLTSITRAFAANLYLAQRDDEQWRFVIPAQLDYLRTQRQEQALQEGLSEYFARPLRIHISAREGEFDTPAAAAAAQRDAAHQAALDAVDNDPVMQRLQERFDARIIPGSIHPLDA